MAQGQITIVDYTDGISPKIRYSALADHSDMAAEPMENVKWIGTSKDDVTDFTNPNNFNWSEYIGKKGDKGDPGESGISITKTQKIYYLSSTGGTPERSTLPDEWVEYSEGDEQKIDTWVTVIPKYVNINYRYFSCIQYENSIHQVNCGDISAESELDDIALKVDGTTVFMRAVGKQKEGESDYTLIDGGTISADTVKVGATSEKGIGAFQVYSEDSKNPIVTIDKSGINMAQGNINLGPIKKEDDTVEYNFSVNSNGTLKARNAYLEGSFYANQGGTNKMSLNDNGINLGNAFVYDTKTDTLWLGASTIIHGVTTTEGGVTVIDGSKILTGSIDAKRITVPDLRAFDATIGGFHIGENSIYSGNKSTINNTEKGIYLDSKGQSYFGNADNFIKFYQEDNKYKLHISADSILFGSGVDIEEAFETATEGINAVQGSIEETNVIVSKELVASSYAEIDGNTGTIKLYGIKKSDGGVSSLELNSEGIELSDGSQAKAKMYSKSGIGGVFKTDQIVSNTFLMGRFAWIVQSSGHLTLKDMGGINE